MANALIQCEFADSYQKCEEVAQETCYNRPGVAPKREQVYFFVSPCLAFSLKSSSSFARLNLKTCILNALYLYLCTYSSIFIDIIDIVDIIAGVSERACSKNEMRSSKVFSAHSSVR